MKKFLLKSLLFIPLLLTSCAGSGFNYSYGYGAVPIEIQNMRFSIKENVEVTSESSLVETIPWGRYLEYSVEYSNIAYYWQELPLHHYYFGSIPRGSFGYYESVTSLSCSADTIERGETETCTYLILLSINPDYVLVGNMNLFVTTKKNERLFFIPILITNWKITANELASISYF